MAQFSFRFVSVNIYDRALHKELNTRAGGLWKWLEVKGDIATANAKSQVGNKTGKLRRSIKMVHRGDKSGQTLHIGSTVKYAYMHHEGTRPHLIVPKDLDGRLVFFSRNQRRVVVVKSVKHPGTKPNRYLSDQLRLFRT
jgi:hypothetical protein